MKTRFLSAFIVLLIALPPTAGCAVFQKLRPALTAAAVTLLVELDALLGEYENASFDEKAGSEGIRAFTTSQDALYRDISDLLTLCHGEIPTSTLKNYRARLDVASARAP